MKDGELGLKITSAADNQAAIKVLFDLWREVKSGSKELGEQNIAFLNDYCAKDREQAALSGLLLWESEGKPQPVPVHLKIRVLPVLLFEPQSEVEEAARQLQDGQSMSAFFEDTSDRSFLGEAKDETESWYMYRILGSFTREACEAYDRRVES